MDPSFEENPRAIRLLARAFGVAELEVFGSVDSAAGDPVAGGVDILVRSLWDQDVRP